jgi:3-oxoacyl-[acyl-carrier-protein] synthase II
MLNRQEIVITGLGVVSPIGIGIENYWNGLASGKSGIQLVDPDARIEGHPIFSARVLDFDPKDWVKPRKSIKVMSYEIQIAYAAAMMAWEHSLLASGSMDPERLGVVFGSEIMFSDFREIEVLIRRCSQDGIMNYDMWSEYAPSEIFPLWMLRSLPNMAACHVGIAVDARGPNNTITTEETSSLSALVEAASVIQRGNADVMIVGASASRSTGTRLIQRHQQFFSKCDSIEDVCRPFDAERLGAVPGEGSAVMVIESRQHAEQRGANILAQLAGWGSSFVKPSEPLNFSSQAVSGAIATCLTASGWNAADLDYINCSANGSIEMDRAESLGVSRAAPVAVNSLKAAIGDSGCCSGMMELVGCILALQNDCVTPTLSHRKTAGDCPVDVVAGSPRELQRGRFLKLSSTPHGHSVAVAVSKP